GPVLSEDHRSGVRSEHPRAGGQLLQLRRVRAREGLIPAKECCDVVHRVMTSENRGYSTTMPASILSRLTPADLLRERLIGGIDISPDGALIAYSERTVVTGRDRSSIWVVPFSGRRPRRLTYGAWSDTRPRFSPDGGTIAFLSDREREG